MKKLTLIFAITTVCTILAAQSASAVTYFYVDPDWGGAENGTASNPWTSLANSTWSQINSALATDDVTIYFSAKEATVNTNETTSNQISIRRTDMSTHRLTLSGMDMYNANDAAPNWLPNPGAYKFHITTGSNNIYTSAITTAKQNYVTIRGFKATNTGSGKCISYWAGDHIVIEYNDLTQTATATAGPTLYYQCILNDGDTSCPGDRDGGASCFPSTDIRISNNTLHDGYGEGLYFCGCYTQTIPECANGTGGHTNVVITDNTFWDISTRGGQGDAIEVKPSVSGLTISRNTLYNSTPATREGHGIIFNSDALIEDNLIYNMGQAGIEANENADNATGFRDGVIIRNNVIVNDGNGPFSWTHGIHFNYETGGDDWQNVEIYNNTIWGANGHGIKIDSPGGSNFKVANNVISNAAGIELYVRYDAMSYNDYNFLHDDVGTVSLVFGERLEWNYDADTDSGLPPNSIIGDPGLLAPTITPVVDTNFSLAQDSDAIGAGVTLTGFTKDYMGYNRTAPWDIGAMGYYGVTPHIPPTTNTDEPGAAEQGGGGCFIGILQ